MKRSLEKTTASDDEECEFIPLTKDNTSWIRKFAYSDKLGTEKFNRLWEMHPTERAEVMIVGKLVKVPRFQMTYGATGYHFSGVKHEAQPITPFLQPFLDYANRVCAPYLKPYGRTFNMIFVNWYNCGHNYIGAHSDDEKQLVKTPNGETLVFSLTFGATRTFRLHPRAEGEDNIDIELSNGSAILMGGLTQKSHKHSVPKIGGKKGEKVGRRVNLTLRMFK